MKEERLSRVVAFYRNFRYEGILIRTTDLTYVIDDDKEGLIYLPISNTVLKGAKK